jgi:hypothetical protein
VIRTRILVRDGPRTEQTDVASVVAAILPQEMIKEVDGGPGTLRATSDQRPAPVRG